MLLGCDKSLNYQETIRLREEVPKCRPPFILKVIFLERFFRSLSRLKILIVYGEFCSCAQHVGRVSQEA